MRHPDPRGGHGEPCVLKTATARVRAYWVVIAPQLPIIADGRFFAKAFPRAHSVVAARLGSAGMPEGMFISAGEPTRSFRRASCAGADYVIATGPIFRPGESDAEEHAFEKLEGWLAATFDIGPERFSWTNEDFRLIDGLPFVGAASRDSPHLLVATGFNAWGITTGVVAAQILAATVQSRSHPLAPLLDASRLRPLKGAPAFVSQNIQAGAGWSATSCSGRPPTNSTRAPAIRPSLATLPPSPPPRRCAPGRAR